MPRDELLRGFDVQVARGDVPVAPGENGEPQSESRWMLILLDRQSQDTIRFTFDDRVRDYLVRELTGGVVLAGGNLPKL